MSDASLPPSDSTPPVAPLDELMQDQFCNVMRLGCSRLTAADYLRISPEAVRETLRRVPSFAVELAQAEATSEVNALRKVRDAQNEDKDWRAAAWVLERRDPDRYVARKPGQITPEQAAEFLRQLTAIVVSEVGDVSDRRRVIARLHTVTEQLHLLAQLDESP